MYDKVLMINKSVIQHGKYNNRVYLVKLHDDDLNDIFTHMDKLVSEHDYTKIFAKIPVKHKRKFLLKGFIQEAEIPGFYDGSEDCILMGRFIDQNRQVTDKVIEQKMTQILAVAQKKKLQKDIINLSEDYYIKTLEIADVEELTELYKVVFDSYPFPIFDPKYIIKTMNDNVTYYGVFHEGKLLAASSAYRDEFSSNVEMTDFATFPESRGMGLAVVLLAYMEAKMRELNIKTFYTIAGSMSFGMNITFSKMGYEYGGTLMNNTNISGQIESMNVWYK